MTLVDGRTNLAKEVIDTIRMKYGMQIRIFDTQIPVAVKAAEATKAGQSIFEYDRSSKPANAYVPPYLLFQKEKDMLQPLPSPHVIDSYREYDRRAKVQKDSLIVFRKSHYSVPPEYIGKTVHLKAFGDDLRIYFENRCIAEHKISDKRINYDRDHYLELLKPLVRKDDLESFAEQNLRQFDSFL
jgi:hypothetical protein